MGCPRCGSNKTSRSIRKDAVTKIEDQSCDDCGWYGNRNIQPASSSKVKPPAKSRAKAKKVEVPQQVPEPEPDERPREDDPCSYLFY